MEQENQKNQNQKQPEANYEELSKDLAKQVSDLKAEMESFKSENDKLKEQYAALQAENQKTKELNFTLARTVDAGQKRVTAEEAIYNLFLGGQNGYQPDFLNRQ